MTGISRQALGLGLCPVLAAVSTLGCATFEQQVWENPKTVVGAAAGAAGGLLLGGLIFHSTAGALAGGLIGTLAGGLIGSAVENQKRDYPATAETYGHSPGQNTSVRIEKAEVQPATVRPGGTVNLIVHYVLLTPDPHRKVSAL